jgi:hypothetical protein
MGWWKSLRTDGRKLCQLREAEARLLLEAALLLPLTRVALRYLGLRRWQATLARFSSSPPCSFQVRDDGYSRLAARSVAAAAARVAPGDTCLAQALVLWWLLRRRGLDGGLRIGVRKNGEQLAAHAWIEYRGFNLGPRPQASETFVPFSASIGPSRRRCA